KREVYRDIIIREAHVGVGIAEAGEIGAMNMYEAARIAMQRAVESLAVRPDHLLVDAMTVDAGVEETSIIKGDANSVSIAAASVIAETTRDRMMAEYDMLYPGSHLSSNNAYGTNEHLAGLEDLGATPIHRKTFEPVNSLILKH